MDPADGGHTHIHSLGAIVKGFVFAPKIKEPLLVRVEIADR